MPGRMPGRSPRRRTSQPELFPAAKDALSAPRFPDGLVYALDFLAPDEEAELLATIATLPLTESRYREYTAKRRTVSYGSSYDFSTNVLSPAPPIADFLLPLRARIAAWTGIPATAFVHGLVTEYRPGTQLGWHRDVPSFGTVVGVSLAGVARMRFRRWPHVVGKGNTDGFVLDLAPRSAYVLQREVRWRWQHAISPTKALRYSITFRTSATDPPA
jgi:alkylated DNA repair dioxygenase AlkB